MSCRTVSRALGAALVALALAGCWDSHDRAPLDGPSLGCVGLAVPRCAAQREGACGPWTLEPAICEGGAYVCPLDAVELTAAPSEPGGACRPFYEEGGPIVSLELLAGVPSNGACAWMAQFVDIARDDGSSGAGATIDHAALRPDTSPDFGACPVGEWVGGGALPESVADEVPGELLSILDSTHVGVETWVSVRRYAWDAAAPWPGLRNLGSGFARWDATRERLEVGELIFAPELDLGDALLAHGDDLYTLGCTPPSEILHEDCVLARSRASSPTDREGWRFLQRDGTFAPAHADAATVFLAGPERSSMRWVPGLSQLLHLYVEGFGDTIYARTADAPEGPWSEPFALLPCELPDEDPEAYCGSPTLRMERIDPRTPEVLAISYDVTTLAEDRVARVHADPGAYWPRLVHVRL